LHIALFGRRNAGKSSLVNSLSGQEIALVSDVPGTTTDPVYKSMELLPVGPVVLIDTAGIDDEGDLGRLRVERTMAVLEKTDVVILVVDAEQGISDYEKELADLARRKGLGLVGVVNKADLNPGLGQAGLIHSGGSRAGLIEAGAVQATAYEGWARELDLALLPVSARNGDGIDRLKARIVEAAPPDWIEPSIVGDLVSPGDIAVLVVPIDLAAPKGRLILPQVEVLRDLLDHDAMGLVVKERELKEALFSLGKKPRIVITDSQAFLKADADTPPDVLLTSFSILMARHKGDLEELVRGALAIDRLQPGDRVLISEVCTHHRQADDIGTVKIPRWLRQRVGGELQIQWSSGSGYPADLSDFKLVVHCGACMTNRREMLSRIRQAGEARVPIVNYGVAIAHLHGILRRALSPFPHALMLLDDAEAEAS
jgi:small GTP-binding protein